MGNSLKKIGHKVFQAQRNKETKEQRDKGIRHKGTGIRNRDVKTKENHRFLLCASVP